MEDFLSRKQAAHYLGISPDSVSNWVRRGLIKQTHNLIKREDLELLKNKICSGEVDRLKSRANKSNSGKIFLPGEYLHNEKNLIDIENIISYIRQFNISIELAVYLLSLNLFKKSQDILSKNENEIFKLETKHYRRRGVCVFLKDWFKHSFVGVLTEYKNEYTFLINTDLPEEKDLLGIIYQSLLQEGKKSGLGSYYTPKDIVEDLVKNRIKKDFLVLDPCCGTGQFLLSFSDYIENPLNIYAYDIDYSATRIAGVNLLLRYKDIDFSPNIFNEDFLTIKTDISVLGNNTINKFDFIATNPPWGAKYSTEHFREIQSNIPEVETKESFALFIAQSYRLLKEGAHLSFVLPESLTNIKVHKNIRAFILEKFFIEKINILGKKFKNVLSSVVSLHLIKSTKNNPSIKIVYHKNTYVINQDRFQNNRNLLFDIYINSQDEEIISEIENRDSLTLENSADWALGIVTGDNNYFIKKVYEKNLEAVVKGSDVQPFVINEINNYIIFEPEKFQQIAKLSTYRAKEKLIYRFISSFLVFAYDDKQRLTLNSANILIPKLKDYPVKLVAAFFNSELFNFYFKKKFNAIKILRGDLEQIPLPRINDIQKTELIHIVDLIMSNQNALNDLNQYVYKLYNIKDLEIEYIQKFLGIIKAE